MVRLPAAMGKRFRRREMRRRHHAGIARVERRFEARIDPDATDETAGPFAESSVVVLEGLWKLVRHRATREWVVEQAKRARHLGLWLVAITQQRSDLHTAEANALLVNSSMQLLLRLGADELALVADALELSMEERAQVRQVTTEKHAYAQAYPINGERGRGTVGPRPPFEALDLLADSD